ncbi:ATPase, T2SS/T4P/T4SS family [Propionicimonas sp.]|uniref:GspE/PulE family protein n=1 Tax=Propionicimonas sp. TaxID=1955623 RepID=UPI0017D853DF|nr:ATPase, T2SS/T4P/T4SS family [Propionicimonas sp.]MBU3975595.1 Flp pilus assembly complex ATPase component TadA [Actinomycetota bacterium]MBA3020002.1 type II secretion system protein GspE [Propionicimonas sp.]MBU3986256.1 Flp pilus assembly complex ATPase component TadA [Actinomycetota bacterium]MBU4007825.1 Flp pilus assembly complex ATPase component TadA [Actinomycetota bacterium]MBU4064083.1 Flp pilus assembly complex ATPase component TadA [Actinomycetota bacterium]
MISLTNALIQQGNLTEESLNTLVSNHPGVDLRTLLLERHLISEEHLARAVALHLGRDYFDLAASHPDPAAVGLLPGSMCRRFQLIPIELRNSQPSARRHVGGPTQRSEVLVVGMLDPGDIVAIDDIASLTDLVVEPVVVTGSALRHAFELYLRSDEELSEISAAMEEDAASIAVAAEVGDDQSADAPVVRFVNLLIAQAIDDRASDIHIEPGHQDLTVRFRIDGVLKEMQRADRGIQDGIISRLKIMASIDIAERRRPQDGRISFVHHDRTVDLRVATLPTVWGEKIVMRILDTAASQITMAALAMSEENGRRFRKAITRPHGMILVTGPTGSGKSTTLKAALGEIANPEVNVITIEDPVEYRIPGISQIQVNVRSGLTFASSLRAVLRCDPDIVLVGEIRDQETAITSIEAALTGHLVLSTLHTNDAPSALTRLIEIGAEPYLVASALSIVVAQRLARRLCVCREPVPADPKVLEHLGFAYDSIDPPQLYRPVGCSTCANTGYRGRLALHEVMEITEEIAQLTVRNAPVAEVRETAAAQGMLPLRQDGWQKVIKGLTTIEEVLRVSV